MFISKWEIVDNNKLLCFVFSKNLIFFYLSSNTSYSIIGINILVCAILYNYSQLSQLLSNSCGYMWLWIQKRIFNTIYVSTDDWQMKSEAPSHYHSAQNSGQNGKIHGSEEMLCWVHPSLVYYELLELVETNTRELY